jgi:hypothetical protein
LLTFQGHAQQIREALHEGKIRLCKAALAGTVDLKHTIRFARNEQHHVNGPFDAVLNQDFRRSKAAFALQVIGNDGAACPIRKACRTIKVSPCACVPYIARLPTHPSDQ